MAGDKMTVVLFCGGKGTRIREASELLPKPLISVANLPIITRLMARYSNAGVKEFILATGYLHEKIENYFQNLFMSTEYNKRVERFLISTYGCAPLKDWNVKIINTGECNIGTRLFKLKNYLKGKDYFYANYSDSVSLIDIKKSLMALESTNAVAAIAAVKPSHYYHWLNYSQVSQQKNFIAHVQSIESSETLSHRINGGYMCLRNDIFDHMNYGDELVEEPFYRLIKQNKLVCYQIEEYWRSIDTFKDLQEAETELENMGHDFSD